MSATNCHWFEERLARDDLPEAERRAVEAHLSSCERCGELYGLPDSLSATLTAPVAMEMTRTILDRTSGSSCSRAESRICESLDRDPEPVDRELLELHLRSCEACARLVPALQRLSLDLPHFATLSPDPFFVDDVKAVTSARPRGWPGRLHAGWRRWLMRPRAAWELGYVGAMLLWLVLGAPISPVRGAHTRAIEALKEPVGSIGRTEAPWANDVLATAQRTWQATREIGQESLRGLGTDLKQRYRASEATARRLGSRSLDIGTESIHRALDMLSAEASSSAPEKQDGDSIVTEGEDDASNE